MQILVLLQAMVDQIYVSVTVEAVKFIVDESGKVLYCDKASFTDINSALFKPVLM